MPLTPVQGDFFDRVRAVVVAVMLAAGAALIVGSVIDWVTIAEAPALVEGFDFGESNDLVEEPEVSQPFTGLETTYGTYSLASGIALVLAALMLFLRRRGKWAWLGFAASMVSGGLAIAAYRGIADTASPLYEQLDIVGRAEPALGLTLVAAGAIVGLVSSAAGVAATPNRAGEAEESPRSAPLER